MPYSELLADRLRQVLDEKRVNYVEKKMMGGLCFMVQDKMCVGIIHEDLMARIGPDLYEEALQMKGARKMNFTKRPMKGYVFVDSDGTDLYEDLSNWVQMALDFNPEAKASKKKKKKKTIA